MMTQGNQPLHGELDGARAPDAAPILEARHLQKHFPVYQLKLGGPAQVVRAVEDTSLALYPGRALALVGESGSGKTTVARMLACLYEPTAGSIRFRRQPGKGSSRSSLLAYRRHGQLAFQDPFASFNPRARRRHHPSQS